jgi:protein PhnA
MSVLKELTSRSNGVCEFCASEENLQVYVVPPHSEENTDHAVVVCGTCANQLNDPEQIDTNHWRCLNESMWSEHAPVQVMAYRVLYSLKNEGWPQDLLDMLYLDEETLAWAKETLKEENDPEAVVHRDVNGVVLKAGDSVVLIKDLKVKGSSMVAKQGTAVRRISLDPDNAEYIEGKVDGQHIVIITQYVKKI